MHILNTLLTRKIRLCLLIITVVMNGFYAEAQIYYHNFGTTPIATHPYTVVPSTMESHLSGSSWTNSIGSWTSNTGATGEAIRLTTAAPATITLTFNVAANYQVDITSFNFWAIRSTLGPQNWTMTINGINVGSGTTATVGAALGNTPVTNAVSGLTGTITVVISLSGQTGNGTYRLDDFALFGTVTPNCTAATITSFSPTSGPQNTLVTINGSGFQAGTGTSAVNFNGIPATSFTVVSDNVIKAYIPAGNTSGNISVVTNGCEGFSPGSFTVIVTTPNIVYATDLYISEIYDAEVGSGGVIEIYNGTASTISLAGYSIVRHGDIGGPSTYTLNLDPTLSIAPGQVFLLNVGTTAVPCTGLTYGQFYPTGGFNSNDQFELVHNTIVIDTVEISQSIITTQPGYSITRNPNAIGPKPIFNINDWTLTGTEDCSDLGTHTVTPPNPLSAINVQPTSKIICENGTTTFSVTLANPAGYTFQWKVQSGTGNWINVVNSANYSGVMTNTLTLNLVPAAFNNNQYYCQITSSLGVIVTYAAQLQVNGANIPPTLSTTPPTCLANGFTTITNYNAANTYTFSPTGPVAGAGGTITGAVLGTNYSVSVTNGCPGTSATFTNLAQLTVPLVPTLSTTAPTCTANGFTVITNYNSANTYTFLPAGPTAGTGGSITGAVLGTAYTITASNGSCSSSASLSFTNLAQLPTPLVPTLSTTAPTCTANGFTTITNYNSANTYTFSPTGPSVGTGGSITGAVLGNNYTVTASNGSCSSASSLAFTNLAQLTAPAVPTLSTTLPTCTTDGSTVITNYNSANTYTFSPTGPSVGTGGTITGAVLGTGYMVTSSNGGCTSGSSLSFTNLAQLPTPLVPTLSTTTPTCLANGFTTITNYNAANTYTFLPTGPTAGTGGSITGTVLGTAYTVTASNGGCTSTASLSFTNLVQLPIPVVPTLSTTAPTCTANGFTTITNYNSANTYTFLPTGPTAGIGGSITGTVLGTNYTVTASNGSCSSTASLSFTNLAQLPIPVVPTLSTTAPTCTANGFTTITNYNAANTYTFLPTGPTAGTGGSITGTVLGTAYTVTASNGSCTSASSLSFTNLAQMTAPLVPTLSTTAPTCTANGFTTITNYNAANTYTFSPTGPVAGAGGTITGAVLGTAYMVTSSNGGCTSGSSLSFTNLAQLPTPLVPTLSTTAPTCLANGFTTITNYNSANTYTFSPTGPVAGAGGTITGAVLGTAYMVTSSNGGCTSGSSLSFTNLAQLPIPAVPTLSTTLPTCTTDGSTVITNYNSANTYTFSPTGPSLGTGGTITGAVLGTGYMVTSSNGGCTSGSSLSFTNLAQLPTPLVPTLSTTAPTCTANGFTTITNYNSANTYTFSPTGPVAGAGGTTTGAVLGTAYMVTSSNGGCTSGSSLSFTNLAQLPIPVVPTLSTTVPTCLANGFTTITNYNSANTYTFSPTGPVAGAGGSITGAVLGSAYTVSSFNGGCSSTASLSFTNLAQLPTPLVPTLSTTPPTCTADGFTVITNYNAGNTYTFSPTSPVAGAGGIITGAVLGTAYTVTASNGGCTSAASGAFTNNPYLASIIFINPQPLQACDPNNDGFVTFNLTQLINVITGGNPNYIVSFHETSADAAIGGTTVLTPGSYDNINPWLQTIYIRVSPLASPCYQVLTLQLIVNRTPEATQPADYVLCDNTAPTGYEVFNLTTRIPEILGSINPALTTVTFYHYLADAQAPSNVITNVTAYPNATINSELLYVRVENTATGCYDIVTLNLVVSPLPSSLQPAYPQYSLCDNDQSPGDIGYEVFDLAGKVNSILLGQLGMDVTFYISLGDAQNGTGQITTPLYENQVQYVQTLGIRITNHLTGCYAISTMDIRVEPLPVLTPPTQPYTLCDENQDGYTTFDLTTLIPGLLNGITTYALSFHETIDDARNNGTTIPNPSAYPNINAFMQIIYVRAEDINTHCVSITPIVLNINASPIAPVLLSDIVVCDDDANPQDATTGVDLTQRTADVLAQQPAGSYTVTYYTSKTDAETPNSPIIPDTNHIGSDGDIIWVRVENNATGCFNVGSFVLEINTPLLLTFPTPLSVCDDDAVPNDQLFVFDLTIKNTEINQGTGYAVTYYPSLGDAQNATNVITTPTAYLIQTPPVQTLGVVVTTADGCESITTLDIRVLPIPTPRTNPPALAPKCDDNNPGDMLEVFDLTVNEAYIRNGDPNLTLHYYRTLADAQAPMNEILPPTAASVGGNVWIRVENNRVDYLGNHCYVLVEQALKVNPLPTVISPLAPYRVCDNDADGLAQFDLTNPILAPLILGTLTTGQQSADYTVTYHATPGNAASGAAPLVSPYTNIIPTSDTIYIRVVNNATGCVNATGVLPLAVEPYATATGPQAFTDCDNYQDPYDGVHQVDLTQFESAILNGQNPAVFLVSYYRTQADADAGTNPLTPAEEVAYTTDPDTDTIWVKVENSSNTITPYCYALTTINITVERYPNPIINTPNGVNTICVDFVTGNVIRPLVLDSGITNTAGYTFEWFEAGSPTTVIGTNPAYTVDTPATGGATRSYTVHVTSISALGCDTTSAPFDVIQSGPAVVPAGTIGYAVTDAFSNTQIITVTITGYGSYEYSLDEGPRQTSNIFENVSLGTHVIHVWDTEGGIAYSCEELIINDVQIIDYPHYFTPNGDGIHDTWNIVGLGGQPGAKIYIFDRYGKLLKQISSKGEGWNGTYNGHMLPSDDYWFTVDFMENSVMKQFKAHFALKR